jgi:salicylate hydroxylase
MGAGAGMAFEDAVVLSGLLGKAKSLEDVDKRLGQYDAVRRPRTQELVRLSRLNGLTLAFAEEGIKDDLQLLERAIAERFHWPWDSDFENVLR